MLPTVFFLVFYGIVICFVAGMVSAVWQEYVVERRWRRMNEAERAAYLERWNRRRKRRERRWRGR